MDRIPSCDSFRWYGVDVARQTTHTVALFVVVNSIIGEKIFIKISKYPAWTKLNSGFAAVAGPDQGMLYGARRERTIGAMARK
jgi:hypothetical protein